MTTKRGRHYSPKCANLNIEQREICRRDRLPMLGDCEDMLDRIHAVLVEIRNRLYEFDAGPNDWR